MSRRLRRKRSAQVHTVPFGVDFNIPQAAEWGPVLEAAGNLGIKHARSNVSFWHLVERERGVYDWSRVDEVVEGLLSRGVEPFLNVGLGNPLYAPDLDEGRRYTPLRSAASRAAWVAFLEAAARRYRGRVTRWELGNEPNHPHFWRPTPDPAGYAAYVTAAVRALRRGNADARPMAGAVSGIGGKALEFTRRFLESLPGSPDEHFQVFAYHPYRTVPEAGYAEEMAELRNVLLEGRFTGSLWQGECGYPSAEKCIQWHGEGPWSEEIQAKHLLRRLVADWCAGAWAATWFLLVDFSAEIDPSQGWGPYSRGKNTMGLLELETLRPKRAYGALGNLCALLDGAQREGGSTESGGDGLRVERFRTPSGGMMTLHWQPVRLREVGWQGSAARDAVLREGAAGADLLLIDLLSGEAHALPSGALPVRDYPLAIARRGDVTLDAGCWMTEGNHAWA